MRLSIFVALAFAASLGVGLASGMAGSGFWASVGYAVLTLILLQIAYFLFLIMEARKTGKPELGEKGE